MHSLRWKSAKIDIAEPQYVQEKHEYEIVSELNFPLLVPFNLASVIVKTFYRLEMIGGKEHQRKYQFYVPRNFTTDILTILY